MDVEYLCLCLSLSYLVTKKRRIKQPRYRSSTSRPSQTPTNPTTKQQKQQQQQQQQWMEGERRKEATKQLSEGERLP